MAILIAISGPDSDRKIALGDHRLLMIGRDAACSIQIHDPQLSRNHLQIRHNESNDCHVAIDFDSKNGVFVNGQRIAHDMPLSDRDIIRIGDTTLVYCTDDSLDACQIRDMPKRIGEGHLHTVSDQPPDSVGTSDASAEVLRDREP